MTQPPLPPRRSQTVLGNLSQAVKTTLTRINFSKLKLKPNARVPELFVQDADAPKAQVFPLLGDRYSIGRSSKSCDIVVRNPVVSQVHAVVKRDRKRKFLGLPTRSRFMIRDEGSTNGLYRGKRKLKSKILYNGDVISLGPPELAASVRVQYKDPLPWYLKAVRYGLFGISGVTALTAAVIGIEWQRFSVYPLPESVQGPVVINSRDGQPLRTPRTDRHVELQSLSDFSSFLPDAVMASEDSRFFWHLGVDPIGTARALFTNVRGGEIREGGSTLTQQLARSVLPDYVGRQDSAGRKIREAFVALKLETVYSKDFLLRLYLNRVYLGSGIYGFEDASQFYFGKSSKDLNLSEAATLVGILPAPNSFNPVTNYKAAVEYRDRVLERMAQQGMVSQEEADRARRSRIEISPRARQELQSAIAPYFYSAVFDELESLLGGSLASEGNFIVETGLDRRMQSRAEASLRNSVETNGASAGYSQGAMVTINAKTGEVLAMVGGTDYRESQFNRATQALRQPGSTFKIFAYTAAIEQNISPGTAYSCAPLNWGGQTYAGCGGGSADFYTGVAQSLNVIALRVAQDVGLDKVVQMAQRLGVKSKLNPVPGLVLGQSEVTPLEMTSAFGVLANDGVRNRPHTIKRILDSGDCKDRKDINTCRVIYQADQDGENNQRVLQPEVAATMTTLFQGVVRSGTGRAAAIGLGEAGKTGTTNDNKDLWFVGYVPSQAIVTGVWLGNDNNAPTDGNSGLAAKLWGDYMRQVVR
ncbi:PBP1A family penicillin-binding protein [Leptolyngbya sp. NIES-2104]|uniref:PBP1A family penicillin-binding protein n=1 Tax=Leptolyngbya sp. NIES-2104 TaxID=1552121 RepID=UPI0006EC855F|nr:PBP1A family penicillin-binding protein [Leptolyngbya sp. NIES-2104]GAP97064.1 multimodular transpeptidase-transglycosylase [Leptolyngbya sp. NIES-2104]